MKPDSALHPVAWRDSFSTWPSLRVQVELLPWHWRLRWYRDDIEPAFNLTVGPVTVEFFANRKPFALERVNGIN